MVIALGVRMKGEGPQGQRGGEGGREGWREAQSRREAEGHRLRVRVRDIQAYSTAEGNKGEEVTHTSSDKEENTTQIHVSKSLLLSPDSLSISLDVGVFKRINIL